MTTGDEIPSLRFLTPLTMKIDFQDLHEFITHYERVSGECLSEDEARIMLSRLIPLYRILLKPISDERKNDRVSEEHSHRQKSPQEPSAP